MLKRADIVFFCFQEDNTYSKTKIHQEGHCQCSHCSELGSCLKRQLFPAASLARVKAITLFVTTLPGFGRLNQEQKYKRIGTKRTLLFAAAGVCFLLIDAVSEISTREEHSPFSPTSHQETMLTPTNIARNSKVGHRSSLSLVVERKTKSQKPYLVSCHFLNFSLNAKTAGHVSFQFSDRTQYKQCVEGRRICAQESGCRTETQRLFFTLNRNRNQPEN